MVEELLQKVPKQKQVQVQWKEAVVVQVVSPKEILVIGPKAL